MFWQLQDAKARFSELVNKAHNEGPQIITKRGKKDVVLIDFEEYQKMMLPPSKDVWDEWEANLKGWEQEKSIKREQPQMQSREVIL